jgi:uncharacterized membrane protein YvbJ
LPSLANKLLSNGGKEMFCNYCGKQNKDDALFCEFCGKAMSQKNSPLPETQNVSQANQSPKKEKSPKNRISFTAIKAIVTGIVILALVIIVFQIYYPGWLPWNW